MFTKRARLWLGLIAAASLLSLASSCSKTPEEGGGSEPSGKAYTSKGDEGTISGKVSYAGTAPAPVKIQTDADPACSKASPNLTSEEWVVKDGKVANTFVYIKDGTLADGTKFGEIDGNTLPGAKKSAVVLDQNGCHYKPHVLGVMVNQDISITNSDPTNHNIHFMPKNSTDWNHSQLAGAGPMTYKVPKAEVLVQVKCDQHPWMKSYVGALKHPLFAVSGDDGSFTITGVPPGKYTVAAWHEGASGTPGTEQKMEVTVAAKGAATADFQFGASAALRGQPSSLPMLPALEVPMMGKP